VIDEHEKKQTAGLIILLRPLHSSIKKMKNHGRALQPARGLMCLSVEKLLLPTNLNSGQAAQNKTRAKSRKS